MKKLLLAGVAAVAMAAVATPAAAEIELELGGFAKGYFSYVDQDEAAGLDVRPLDIIRHTEVHAGGETTLDNGLTVGVRLEAEADGNDAAGIEESYAYFSGGWGRVNVGAEDGSNYLLQVAAPSADSNVDGVRSFVQPLNLQSLRGAIGQLNAIAAYTKALNSSVETYGEHHRGVSIIYTKLGNLYGDQGEWNQALACYYQSLVINDAIYNGENTAICMDRINIASSLCEFYDFDEANEHLYEGISMLLGMEERNPIAVANLYFNIAKNKESIDDYHGAAISYDKARSYLQEYSNANQSEIFSYMMSAAEAYEKGSEYDYAFDLYLEADLLINSPCNLARIQLANISSILGDHRRGLRQINNVVNLFNSAVISNYSLYIRCLIVKAKILYRSGREIEALGCYENAYKLNVECFGKENSVSIMILRETIKIFIEIGALEKAAKNLGTLIYLQENDLNNRAIESVETIDLIAKFNIKKEKFLIAEECLLDALQIRKNYLHDRHSEIAINYSVLGEFYCKLSNFDKALFYYKEAEKLFESTLGECNKTTIEFYSKLADFYVVCDNFKLVVEVRYKALCGARTIFGDTHEITLSYLADYIVACINNDNNHRIDELVSDLINGINDKSIKLSKDRYRSLLAIGKYYSLQGEHVAANEIFNLYLTHTVIYSGQKSREAVYARVMLSKSLIDGKKYEEALDVIKRAINIINESDVDSDVGNLMPLCQEIYRSILAKRI